MKLVTSHPGLEVGPDGGFAQALEDVAALRAFPGMTVLSPPDTGEMQHAVRAIFEFEGPVYVRTGRGPAPRVPQLEGDFTIGRGTIVRDGSDVTIVARGVEVARAIQAADELALEGIDARVVSLPSVKPADREFLAACAEETGCIVTAKDHNILGGLGGAVAEVEPNMNPCPFEFVGVADTFGDAGEPAELATKHEIHVSAISAAVRRALARRSR